MLYYFLLRLPFLWYQLYFIFNCLSAKAVFFFFDQTTTFFWLFNFYLLTLLFHAFFLHALSSCMASSCKVLLLLPIHDILLGLQYFSSR